MEFDKLTLLRNTTPIVLGSVHLVQPTLGEIEELGWEKYQTYVSLISSTSLDIADILWSEYKIWYEDIKDEWVFFIEKSIERDKILNIQIDSQENHTVEGIGINDTLRDALNYFLGLNGEYIVVDMNNEDDNEVYLYNVKLTDNQDIYQFSTTNFKLTRAFHSILVDFLQCINWSNQAEYDFTKGGTKATKKYLLKQRYRQRHKNDKPTITIDSIVSSIIAKTGNYKEIWDYPIYMIYDIYNRYVKIDDWNNTMEALHSGCIDTSKHPIQWEKINWSSIIN